MWGRQVCALGLVWDASGQKILLVKRTDVPVWVLPGGGVEEGETPTRAVVREVFEESGLRVGLRRCALELHPINRLATKTYLFECDYISGSPCKNAEAADVAFFLPNALPQQLFSVHAEWIKEVIALQGKPTQVRPLKEITWVATLKYLCAHPKETLLFIWTTLRSFFHL
jgi:ADP-ribose pyrophosphatase